MKKPKAMAMKAMKKPKAMAMKKPKAMAMKRTKVRAMKAMEKPKAMAMTRMTGVPAVRTVYIDMEHAPNDNFRGVIVYLKATDSCSDVPNVP